MMVSQEIRNQKFKNGLYGYSQGEVEEFLNRLAVEFENLYADNERLKARIRNLRAQADVSQGIENKVNNLQSVAFPVAQRIREEAMQGAQELFDNTEPHFERLRDSFKEIMQRVEYLNEEAHTLLNLDGHRCSESPSKPSALGETRLTEMADEIAQLRDQAQQIIDSMDQWQRSLYAESRSGPKESLTIEGLMSAQWNALKGEAYEKNHMSRVPAEEPFTPVAGDSLILKDDNALGADLWDADASFIADGILHIGSVKAEDDFVGSLASTGKELIQLGGTLASGEETAIGPITAGGEMVKISSDPVLNEGEEAWMEGGPSSGQSIEISSGDDDGLMSLRKADKEADYNNTGMALDIQPADGVPGQSVDPGMFLEEKPMGQDFPVAQNGSAEEKMLDGKDSGKQRILTRRGLFSPVLLLVVVLLGLAAGVAWKNDLIDLPSMPGLTAPSAAIEDPAKPIDETPVSPPPARETTPLLDAVKAGDAGEVKALLVAGESSRELNRQGESPLMVAAYKNDLEIMELLLDGGADPNISEQQWGGTPLMYASYMGQLSTVEMLNDSGADLDIMSKEGWTALMCAAYAGRPQTAGFLVVRGADPYVENPDGLNAYDLALLAGRSITAASMVQAGVEPSPQNSDYLAENSLEDNLLIMFSDKFDELR